jgi:Spy/CpxP family protein refolding chaperone
MRKPWANPQMLGEPPFGDMPLPIHHMPVDGELALPLLLHQINLTEKQQSKIKTLVKAHFAEIDTKLEDLRSIGIKIHRLSFSNDYNDDKIQALFDKATAIHRETALQKSRLDNAIFKLLTLEQQQKLQSKMAHCED